MAQVLFHLIARINKNIPIICGFTEQYMHRRGYDSVQGTDYVEIVQPSEASQYGCDQKLVIISLSSKFIKER